VLHFGILPRFHGLKQGSVVVLLCLHIIITIVAFVVRWCLDGNSGSLCKSLSGLVKTQLHSVCGTILTVAAKITAFVVASCRFVE
jgi:hypothetical protein